MNALHGLGAAGWGTRLFFLFWLAGWAIGELLVAVVIAWQLAGRDVMTVTHDQLEVRRQLGRFDAETGRAHVLAIQGVQAERVPSGDDEKRTDFRLRIVSAAGSPLLVGEGMDEHVAEQVASVVRSYVRRQPRWDDDSADFSTARSGMA
jgi:hypothetical protein